MRSLDSFAPRTLIAASALVFVWVVFFSAGAYAGYTMVRDHAHAQLR